MNPPEGHFFDLAKKMLFTASLTEGTAGVLGVHSQVNITFKRVAELQLELTNSIELTLNSGFIRSTYAQIRTSLELCSSFSWLAKDFDGRYERFSSERLPSIQRMMNELKWKDEYDKTYRVLSKFVHGNTSIFDMTKERKVNEDINQINDTITSDYFLNLDLEKPKLMQVDNIPISKLIKEHQPLVELKVFDIVLVNLIRASGTYSDSFNWWPGKEQIEIFTDIVNFRTNDHFLWQKEKYNLAICKVEGIHA